MKRLVAVVSGAVLAMLLLFAGLIDMVNGSHGWVTGSEEQEFVNSAYSELSLYKRTGAYNLGCSDAEAQQLWDALIDVFDGNAYAAAGAMGNLFAESRITAMNLQDEFEGEYNDLTYTQAVDSGDYTNFVGDGYGYGIAQWTYYTRKAHFYYMTKACGVSISDFGTQVDLLIYELKYDFPECRAMMCAATSVADASYIFLTKFEKPDTPDEKAPTRREYSENFYAQFALSSNTGWIADPNKTNLGLVEWVKLALNSHWGYVWGTFGEVLTEGLLEAKMEQYPDNVPQYEDFIRENWLGKRTADCIGLIKSYSWWDADEQRIIYLSNNHPEAGTEYIFSQATVKGTIDTLPEIPGLVLYKKGHVGVYIGNGEVIESAGTKEGVIKTQIEGSAWTHWLKSPWITYVDAED